MINDTITVPASFFMVTRKTHMGLQCLSRITLQVNHEHHEKIFTARGVENIFLQAKRDTGFFFDHISRREYT